MKVSELSGALLDYWVAMAGEEWKHFDVSDTMTLDPSLKGVRLVTYGDGSQAAMLEPNNPFRQDPREFCPSSYWKHGGPIIEREHIDIIANGNEWDAGRGTHIESSGEDQSFIEWIEMDGKQSGPTPLVAAMRAFVASKFGDEVPQEPPTAP